MTRETKIGLLVGLAFIIVIGILLSDHLTSSTEPPQATLATAGNTVRSAVAAPGSAGNVPTVAAIAPAPVISQQTVPTPDDLAVRPQPVQPVQPVQVAVGGPAAQRTRSVVTSPDGPTDQTADNSNVIVSRAVPMPANETPQTPEPYVANNNTPNNTDVASSLRTAAQQHGEELVPAGNTGGSTALVSGRQTASGMKQYVAAEGDSVSRMAARFLGGNTRINREAIVNANPALKQDVNKIIVDRTYNIPTGVPTSVSMASTQTPTPASVIAPPTPQPVATPDNIWYTVKEGDTLTRIAQEQCGSTTAVAAIIELNKESLRDPNVVVANTKLRLPGKPN